MSGICGIVSLDGNDPSVNQIKALIKGLERRGPDGSHHWRDHQVALGHTLLATTPESLVEVLPLNDPESGCTITADVRLDNREELIEALGLSSESRTVGDGELVLRAYRLWGEDCPAHLLGDFAFAIWDPSNSRLFCARDHMGVRQLSYYHNAAKIFVFATEPEAVLAHESAPRRINEGRVADYLEDLEGLDLTSTLFDEVSRLPPAHSLSISKNHLSIRRYWELQPGPELELGTDEAYADAFLEVFTKAVRCRLRSATPVASMLSGGIDSGSVAAVAAKTLAANGRGPLSTFSAIGPDFHNCVETRAILEAAKHPGFAPVFVNYADMAAYHGELVRLTDGAVPFDSHMTLIRAVYLAAHKAQKNVVLDGVAGDVVLSAGNCVAQWMRQGRIFKAFREARAEKAFWGPPWQSWSIAVKAAWVAFVPISIRNFRSKIVWRIQDQRIHVSSMVAPELASRINLRARREQYRRYTKCSGIRIQERKQLILDPHLVAARERYDRVASALAIEPRDPFLDIRVVEFCLSLPWKQLQGDGWPKIILRRAMRGKLMPSVIWRRGKEHLGWVFTQSFFNQWEGWTEGVHSLPAHIGRLAKQFVPKHGNRPTVKELDNEEQIKLFSLSRWIYAIQARYGRTST